MKRKLIVIFILLLLLLALVSYKYIYHDHRDIQNEQVEFNISSTVILTEFSQNPLETEKKYADKTIEISGIVTEINQGDLTLNNNVFCLLNSPLKDKFAVNDNVKIKGRFIGYDDLLGLVKLDQCTLIY